MSEEQNDNMTRSACCGGEKIQRERVDRSSEYRKIMNCSLPVDFNMIKNQHDDVQE